MRISFFEDDKAPDWGVQGLAFVVAGFQSKQLSRTVKRKGRLERTSSCFDSDHVVVRRERSQFNEGVPDGQVLDQPAREARETVMINEVHFRNFKGLRQVQLGLERFTVLVGPNASGKTSILEGIHLLSRLRSERLWQLLHADEGRPPEGLV
jgi:hypothetical protein